MSGIRSLLIDLFRENKIKYKSGWSFSYRNFFRSCENSEREKNEILQDIIPYRIQNPNINSKVHREIIHIPKYSKISSNNDDSCFLLLDNIFNKEEKIIVTIKIRFR